jgi:hypothetical protein
MPMAYWWLVASPYDDLDELKRWTMLAREAASNAAQTMRLPIAAKRVEPLKSPSPKTNGTRS